MIKNETLLNHYIENFYGYGNIKSDYWFIGKEEAGGETHQEINSRIENWENLKSEKVVDIYDFHKNVINEKGENFEFLFKNKIQKTWLGLIKMLYSLQGVNWKNSELKTFRTESLGRTSSNNCLLEMFPLPSPKTTKFNYVEWTDFKNREDYKNSIKEVRIDKIKNLIQENQPKFVIFYSTDKEYCSYWKMISGIDFDEIKTQVFKERKKNSLVFKVAKKGNTTYAIINHPTYMGVSDEYYKTVGEKIRTVANNGYRKWRVS